MLARIEIGLKDAFVDSFGQKINQRIRTDLNLPVQSVRTIKVFTVDAGITPQELEAACARL